MTPFWEHVFWTFIAAGILVLILIAYKLITIWQEICNNLYHEKYTYGDAQITGLEISFKRMINNAILSVISKRSHSGHLRYRLYLDQKPDVIDNLETVDLTDKSGLIACVLNSIREYHE